ncbi:MAG TPA: hypothetical protein VFL45_02795 [Gammaproteobacteria bacterium]|nr:hypothetical protein [Gammaproteobacteria bacterium]
MAISYQKVRDKKAITQNREPRKKVNKDGTLSKLQRLPIAIRETAKDDERLTEKMRVC